MTWLPAVAILALLSPVSTGEQSYGQPATPKVVAYVQMALQQGDLQSAAAMVAQYRKLYGDTPEALEAFSWLARGELIFGHRDQAVKDAEEIERISRTTLATRKLDAEPHLPLALGAAYEVQAEALAQTQRRAEALQLLQTALKTWRGTSLVDRLQKNINLMTLQGKPMPLLRETKWIGVKPQPENMRRGKVLLLFFWAHWCADCKAEAPIIAKLATEFEPKGLAVIAPTRLYGYTAQEEHAAPAVELPFVEKVYQKYYSDIPNAQVPVDAGNFERFGASTTPTIVLVDRQGIVRLYHPGAMEEASLRAAIEPLVQGRSRSASVSGS
ncbi:MAG TPA: TlpA disulfide reductase family protein [Bryobacteraceae bacterium]|jgi:thiol-disulfide isomerase/thioredoxin